MLQTIHHAADERENASNDSSFILMDRELIVTDTENEQVSLKEMSRKQRRVLGVLLEKAFTVPDQYPMTLKATTTGCNQKNNRDPISTYDEDDVQETLSELQARGLVGCLHTESGRTERYRHYMRHKTKLNEPQLAIMTELMLRGKQQVGELRTRASRMVAIDSQDDLRRELQALMAEGLVRANGPLDRRGIEVDHDLYPHNENHDALSEYRVEDSESSAGASAGSSSAPSRRVSSEGSLTADGSERFGQLESAVRQLREELSVVKADFRALQDRFDEVSRQVSENSHG